MKTLGYLKRRMRNCICSWSRALGERWFCFVWELWGAKRVSG